MVRSVKVNFKEVRVESQHPTRASNRELKKAEYYTPYFLQQKSEAVELSIASPPHLLILPLDTGTCSFLFGILGYDIQQAGHGRSAHGVACHILTKSTSSSKYLSQEHEKRRIQQAFPVGTPDRNSWVCEHVIEDLSIK